MIQHISDIINNCFFRLLSTTLPPLFVSLSIFAKLGDFKKNDTCFRKAYRIMHSLAHAFSLQWKLIKSKETILNSPKLEVR